MRFRLKAGEEVQLKIIFSARELTVCNINFK